MDLLQTPYNKGEAVPDRRTPSLFHRDYPGIVKGDTLLKSYLKTLSAALAVSAGLLTGQAFADHHGVSDIKAPADLDNIHVVKLSTDQHSTDFVIFVKKKVPLHKHAYHTETLYVLEGQGDFTMGDKTMVISAGDYIRIPEGTPHAVTVTSAVPLKVLSVQAPEFLGKDRVMLN